MLTKEEMPACPVATTVQLIGSKWKLLILRNLLARPWRFNELRKSLEGISQKVLTDSLRSMEEDGLVTRTVYPEVPPRVEYSLSPLGESMRPIIQAMEQWGAQYKASKARGTAGPSRRKGPAGLKLPAAPAFYILSCSHSSKALGFSIHRGNLPHGFPLHQHRGKRHVLLEIPLVDNAVHHEIGCLLAHLALQHVH